MTRHGITKRPMNISTDQQPDSDVDFIACPECGSGFFPPEPHKPECAFAQFLKRLEAAHGKSEHPGDNA